jgi:Rrf2 family cysteine metabolism transcriptional repressor
MSIIPIGYNLNSGEGSPESMKVSQKGLYALQALIMLARHDDQGAIKIRDIAYEENLPEKFLELILVELKNARIVDSIRGAKGGYKLRRKASDIHLSEIMRLIDGPLAPFGDADSLRALIASDDGHRALYQVFLQVRDAAAYILESTTIADIARTPSSPSKRSKSAKNGKKTRARKSKTSASEARTVDARTKDALDSSGQAKILMLKERIS